MKKPMNKWEERRAAFKAALDGIIAGIIREYRAGGFVAAGWDMVRNAAGIRASRVDGYPLGVNHRWAFAEMFRDAVKGNRAFAKFIMPEGGAL